jgi:futalosine hydrolase
MREIIRKKTCIGILVAVPAEGRVLTRGMKKVAVANLSYYKGNLAGRLVVVVVSGIGKVNASHAATRLIREQRPDLIMNIGVGGAYASAGLAIGDIAVAEKEIYGDEGVMLSDGLHDVTAIGLPLLQKGRKRYFNEFPLDRTLIRKALRSGGSDGLSVVFRSGPFVTVSACTGTAKRAREIEGRFHAVCENMEGAAIAHVCARYGIPMVEMRGISNLVGDRDLSGWNIGLAAENCQRAAQKLISVV